jgi:hypothetical protein
MTETGHGAGKEANTFHWPLRPVLSTPLFSVLTDINGKLLETVAGAQKEWAEFMHRRVEEDIAVSQQLLSCRSLGDVQQIYSQYLLTALEQYQEQSKRTVQRGQATADGLAQTLGAGTKETAWEVRH